MKWGSYTVDPEHEKLYDDIFKNLVIVDSHTHLGEDKDKHRMGAKKLITNMDSSGINKAIAFPLNHPDYSKTFTKPNDIIYRAYKKYPERIIPFMRLNPRYDEWKTEYVNRVEQGFVGIKLHPRSQRFRIGSPSSSEIFRLAEKENRVVIIHTGFGVRKLAVNLKKTIKRFPDLRLILAHAAFIDIQTVINDVKDNDNILFETSSLRIFDLFELMKNVSYKKIIFGSDTPYYDQMLSLQMLVDTALILKKTPNQIKEMLGGNIIRWLK
jgi:predicted TIM-barrel fold metal-dependent hydrolase